MAKANPHPDRAQYIPSILDPDEFCYGVFAVSQRNAKGKSTKRMTGWDPEVLIGSKKGCIHDLKIAMNRRDIWRARDLDELTAKRVAWQESKAAETKTKPGAVFEFMGFELAYLAEPESTNIGLDRDDVWPEPVPEGLTPDEIIESIPDETLRALVRDAECYVELSPSRKGLRILMPRGWRVPEMEGVYRGERDGVGFFIDDRFACTLTLDVLKDGTEFDAPLWDHFCELYAAAPEEAPIERADPKEIADQVLEFGRREVEEFREIAAHVPNDGPFDATSDWVGMIRAVKEYYEVVAPDRLDEVFEIVEEWCERWTDGVHDADKLQEVWDR